MNNLFLLFYCHLIVGTGEIFIAEFYDKINRVCNIPEYPINHGLYYMTVEAENTMVDKRSID